MRKQKVPDAPEDDEAVDTARSTTKDWSHFTPQKSNALSNLSKVNLVSSSSSKVMNEKGAQLFDMES